MKKIILTFVFWAVSLLAVLAQEPENKNICEKGGVVHFDFGAGLNNISYEMDKYGNKNPGGGFFSRLGYRYYFSKNFGLGAGLSFFTLRSNSELDFEETQMGVKDDEIMLENKTRDYTTDYSGLKEKQKEKFMSLPVGFFLRFPIKKNWKINAGISAAYNFSFLQKFETKNSFNTSADYTSVEDGILVNLNGVENLPKHGLSEFKDFKGDADLKKHLFSLGAEFGLGYCLTKNLDLNFGFYFNKVLTNQNNADEVFLYDYSKSVYNGVTQTKISQEIRPLTIGAMVGLSYRLKGKKVPEQPSYDCEQEVRKLKDDIEDLKQSNDDLRRDLDSLQEENDDLEIKNRDLKNQNRDLEDENNDLKKSQDTPPSEVGSDEKELTFEELVYANEPIYFNLNSATGDPKLMEKVDDIAAAMRSHPTRRILIEGHTCDLGSHNNNMQLSIRRAEALRAELIKRGVGPLRIEIKGFAEKEPIVPNISEENRKINRCAIIRVIK